MLSNSQVNNQPHRIGRVVGGATATKPMFRSQPRFQSKTAPRAEPRAESKGFAGADPWTTNRPATTEEIQYMSAAVMEFMGYLDQVSADLDQVLMQGFTNSGMKVSEAEAWLGKVNNSCNRVGEAMFPIRKIDQEVLQKGTDAMDEFVNLQDALYEAFFGSEAATLMREQEASMFSRDMADWFRDGVRHDFNEWSKTDFSPKSDSTSQMKVGGRFDEEQDAAPGEDVGKAKEETPVGQVGQITAWETIQNMVFANPCVIRGLGLADLSDMIYGVRYAVANAGAKSTEDYKEVTNSWTYSMRDFYRNALDDLDGLNVEYTAAESQQIQDIEGRRASIEADGGNVEQQIAEKKKEIMKKRRDYNRKKHMVLKGLGMVSSFVNGASHAYVMKLPETKGEKAFDDIQKNLSDVLKRVEGVEATVETNRILAGFTTAMLTDPQAAEAWCVDQAANNNLSPAGAEFLWKSILQAETQRGGPQTLYRSIFTQATGMERFPIPQLAGGEVETSLIPTENAQAAMKTMADSIRNAPELPQILSQNYLRSLQLGQTIVLGQSKKILSETLTSIRSIKSQVEKARNMGFDLKGMLKSFLAVLTRIGRNTTGYISPDLFVGGAAVAGAGYGLYQLWNLFSAPDQVDTNLLGTWIGWLTDKMSLTGLASIGVLGVGALFANPALLAGLSITTLLPILMFLVMRGVSALVNKIWTVASLNLKPEGSLVTEVIKKLVAFMYNILPNAEKNKFQEEPETDNDGNLKPGWEEIRRQNTRKKKEYEKFLEGRVKWWLYTLGLAGRGTVWYVGRTRWLTSMYFLLNGLYHMVVSTAIPVYIAGLEATGLVAAGTVGAAGVVTVGSVLAAAGLTAVVAGGVYAFISMTWEGYLGAQTGKFSTLSKIGYYLCSYPEIPLGIFSSVHILTNNVALQDYAKVAEESGAEAAATQQSIRERAMSLEPDTAMVGLDQAEDGIGGFTSDDLRIAQKAGALTYQAAGAEILSGNSPAVYLEFFRRVMIEKGYSPEQIGQMEILNQYVASATTVADAVSSDVKKLAEYASPFGYLE